MWNNLSVFAKSNVKSELESKFQIQQEDFPALTSKSQQPAPGANKPVTATVANNIENLGSSASWTINDKNNNLSKSSNPDLLKSSNILSSSSSSSSNQLQSTSNNNVNKKGILISPDGRIQNVPASMLRDQYGMVGLLAYLKSNEKEKDFFTLALGTDLTALGLNLNSNENLYQSFLSPFSDLTCRLQDIDFPVPTEYVINSMIKEKLPPIDPLRYPEDTLFYLFYMYTGDLVQSQAAAALYDRDWRYHIEKRVWLTKVPGMEPIQKSAAFEKGLYIVFEPSQWRRIQVEMLVEYIKLADKPSIPSIIFQQQPGNGLKSQQQQQQHSSSTPAGLKFFYA